MAKIDTSQLTIPSSTGGTDADNQKKLAYVLLQLWQEAKDEAFVMDDGKLTSSEALIFQDAWDAQEDILTYQNSMLDDIIAEYPSDVFPALTNLCTSIKDENTALKSLSMSKSNYILRNQVLETHARILGSELLHIQTVAVQDLQFNGAEIDLDSIKFFLYGKKLLVSP